MADAGLTQEAFYAHFATKSDLYSEAIISGARLRTEQQNTKSALLQEVVFSYLSKEHLTGTGQRCSLAFLIRDISQRDEQARHA